MKMHLVVSSGTSLDCRFIEKWVGEGTCRDSPDVSDLHCHGIWLCRLCLGKNCIQLWFQADMLALLLLSELALNSLHRAPHQQ